MTAKQRVWIELEVPKDIDQAERIATLANTMLQRLNGNSPENTFWWAEDKGRWCYGGNGGFWECADNGQWLNLEHLGRPLLPHEPPLSETGAEDDAQHNAEARAVQNAIATLEACVVRIARKKSWRPSEKAMTTATYTMDIQALRRVLERLVPAARLHRPKGLIDPVG